MPAPFPGTDSVSSAIADVGMGGSFLFLFGSIAVFLIFVLYGVILAYHWFRYSHHAAAATLSLIVYAVGGFILFSILFSSAALLSV